MARYQQNYIGERRTCSIGLKLTPTERAELEAAAEVSGMPLRAFVRDLCVKRSAIIATAANRRAPQARALLRELSAIGNNINQLAKHANTHRHLPAQSVLKDAMDLLKNAMGRVIEL